MAFRVARHLALTSRARGFSALEYLSGAWPQREVRKYRTGSEPVVAILGLHEIELLQRPATSRLRLKWIAPTPPNAP